MIAATNARSDVRSKIVDVATRLLHEQGPSAVTTRGVAGGAGVQAPAIYRLFGDKDGLLDAVAEHVMATYMSAKAAVSQAASADDIDPLADLHAGWQSYIEFGVANPTLYALLSDPRRALRSPATQSGRHVLEARVHRVALTGRLQVSEQRAVDLIHAAGTGTVLTLLSTPPETRDLNLAEEMYEAALRQILIDAPKSAENGPRASAITLRAIAPRLDVLSDAERQLLAEWLDRAIDAL